MKMQPIRQIHASLGIEPNGRVQKFFTDTCAKHMDKYVPMDTGALRTNISKTADSITYESNYAHYQFVNQFPKDHYTTPRNWTLLG